MGIAHKDVKPENLFLTTTDLSTGVIKLSNVYVARFTKCNDLPTTVYCPKMESRIAHSLKPFQVESVGYNAPETLLNKPYQGEAADFWSCGVLLFVLLSDRARHYH